ncbi:hypothetical protein CC80DRAFT_537293 [Byssothecium circinans]|uniref:Uncharacterized protein n=1 Tax=Byssothecium circinans TaxID=147558 RepID=A0A6A5TXM4_9PLEO|nr:hypothetical protein CC80DRAFT_537293 [Byssothecium circinans]
MSSSQESQDPPPGFFSEDLIPALTKLSKLLNNLAQPAVIVFLVLYPFRILDHDWKSNTIPLQVQPSAVLLLLAGLAYFTGFFGEPSAGENRIQLAGLIEPWVAFQTVNNRIGIYFRVGLFAALTVYIPIYHELSAPFQPWLQGLFIIAIAVVGFFTPVEKFNGPLRFGYIEYSARFIQLYQSLPTGWTYTALILILSHFIFPWLGLGIILLSAVAFVYVSHQYRKQLEIIRCDIATEVSHADVAARFARDYVVETKDYEARLLKVVSITRKDVLQAESIRIVDFFECIVDASPALERVSVPAKLATSKARDLVEAANGAEQADLMRRVERGEGDEDDDEDDKGLAEELIDAANLSVKVAEESEFEKATGQHKMARQKAVSIATEAIAASKDLAIQIQNVGDTLYEAVEGAEKVRRLGEHALTVATNGEMQAARSLLVSLKSMAKQVEDMKKILAMKAGAGRSALHELLEKV